MANIEMCFLNENDGQKLPKAKFFYCKKKCILLFYDFENFKITVYLPYYKIVFKLKCQWMPSTSVNFKGIPSDDCFLAFKFFKLKFNRYRLRGALFMCSAYIIIHNTQYYTQMVFFFEIILFVRDAECKGSFYSTRFYIQKF